MKLIVGEKYVFNGATTYSDGTICLITKEIPIPYEERKSYKAGAKWRYEYSIEGRHQGDMTDNSPNAEALSPLIPNYQIY